jgi:hypothetical protein
MFDNDVLSNMFFGQVVQDYFPSLGGQIAREIVSEVPFVCSFSKGQNLNDI